MIPISDCDKKRVKLVIMGWTAKDGDLNTIDTVRSFHTSFNPATEQRINYYNKVRQQSPLSRISVETEHLSKAA